MCGPAAGFLLHIASIPRVLIGLDRDRCGPLVGTETVDPGSMLMNSREKLKIT